MSADLTRILALLGHSEAWARTVAVTALANAWSLSVPLALALRDAALDDRDACVRVLACHALSAHGLEVDDRWMARTYDPTELSEAIHVLRTGSGPERVRAVAVIADGPHISALVNLVQALDADDETLVVAVLRLLRRISHPCAGPAVAAKLTHDADDVRVGAAIALEHIGSGEFTEPLTSLLADNGETEEVRIRAARALGQAGTPRVIPSLMTTMIDANNTSRIRRACSVALTSVLSSWKQLIGIEAVTKALTDPDARVRAHAAELLRYGPRDEVIPVLGSALDDPDASVIAEALDSLIAVDAKGCGDKVTSLLSHQDDHVRNLAIKLVALNRDPETAAVLLSYALRADSEADRKAAGHALRHFDAALVVEPVMEALEDDAPSVRQSAAWIVGEMCLVQATGSVERLSRDESAAVRRAAMWSLATLGVPEAEKAALRLARDDDVAVREWALWGLGEIACSRNAIDVLVAALHDPEVVLKSRAATSLALLGEYRAAGGIVALLSEENGHVKRAALAALAQLRVRCEAAIIPLLFHDPNHGVRRSAATTLGELRSELSLSALTLAARDREPEVRRAAAYAIAQHQDPAALGAVRVMLQDPMSQVRRAAVAALGDLDRPNGCRSVLPALTDVSAKVRVESCRVLAIGGDEAALLPLRRATNDRNYVVQAAATEALGAVLGRAQR